MQVNCSVVVKSFCCINVVIEKFWLYQCGEGYESFMCEIQVLSLRAGPGADIPQ